MNKIIFSFLVFLGVTSYLGANENISTDENNGLYVGFDFLHSPSVDVDLLYEGKVIASDETSSKGLKLKFGTKDENFVYGIHFGYETYDHSLLTTEKSVMMIFGADLRLILPMDETSGIFFKGELDFLSLDLNEPNVNNLSGAGFTFGLGISSFLVSDTEVILGLDYQYRTLQFDDYSAVDASLDYSAVQIYIGMNLY